MNFQTKLEENLKISASKNGHKPLTVAHMANLVSLTNRQLLYHELKLAKEMKQVEDEFFDEVHRYGSSDT